MEEQKYPVECESCGEMILEEDDDFGGECVECYDTPPVGFKENE